MNHGVPGFGFAPSKKTGHTILSTYLTCEANNVGPKHYLELVLLYSETSLRTLNSGYHRVIKCSWIDENLKRKLISKR